MRMPDWGGGHLIVPLVGLGFLLTLGTATAQGPEGTSAAPDRTVTGQVLSAADQRPRAGVPVAIGSVTTQTDHDGRFRLRNPPSGPQLVDLDHAWLATTRRPLPGGRFSTPAHADPVLITVPEAGEVTLTAPIYLVEPTVPTDSLVSDRADVVIRPAHIPGMTVRIPKGAQILADNGRPQSLFIIF